MIKRLVRKVKSIAGGLRNLPLHWSHFDSRCSPATKAAQLHLIHQYRQLLHLGQIPRLSDTGFRNYSQFDEDGLLLYLFAVLGTRNKTFVDIGSGDGINSNCANLALNHGWHGLFIDGNRRHIEHGERYYRHHPDTWAFPPKFVNAMVQRENINQLISDAGFSGEVDLVSIDIDGNDYWIWDALSAIQPRVVMIETHVEFGYESLVVPYDKDYCYPGKHPEYHGASPAAMIKLARQKGYRLVGSNLYGFNTIYVQEGLAEDRLPTATLESVLEHPRNRERFKLADPVREWTYLRP